MKAISILTDVQARCYQLFAVLISPKRNESNIIGFLTKVAENIEIRECRTFDELSECVNLQREVFALPEIEISPVRHLIVTVNAGGFVLGAFDGEMLVGFVLSVPAFLRGQAAFYSHMTAVKASHQSSGIGGSLKWAQREKLWLSA
jgi:predicted GNAT superfamily acetyltransferase